MFYGYYFSTVFGWIWNTPKKDDEQNELHTSDIPISSEADTEEHTLALNEAMAAAINDPPPQVQVEKPLASRPMQVVGKKKQQKKNKHRIH
jgi:hypothetical protein